MWVGLVISPATFHHGNGGELRAQIPSDPGQAGGGAVAAADRLAREGLRPLLPLEPARRHIVNSVGSGEEIWQRKEISLFVLINSYIHIFYNKTIYMHYYVPQHLSP